MGTAHFEEQFEAEIEILEAGPPAKSSYPYPSLAPTGRLERRTFDGVGIENEFLRATFLPGLGGRLISLIDRRSNAELLPVGPLRATPGGQRGADLRAGMEIHLDGAERLTSTALVQTAVTEEDGDSPAAIWLSEAVNGSGMSWHLRADISPDRPELRLEARVFNRTFREISYRGGLRFPASEARQGGAAVWTRNLAIIPERGRWDASRIDGLLTLSRFAEPRMLGPRQLDTWRVSIVPIDSRIDPTTISSSAAIAVSGDSMRLLAAVEVPEGKVVLLTGSGQTLESRVHLEAGLPTDLALPPGVSSIALLDRSGRCLVRWDRAEAAASVGVPNPVRVAGPIGPNWIDASESTLLEAEFDMSTRHVVRTVLGVRALAGHDPETAQAEFESALMTNSEDHLTWWLQAMAERLADPDDSDAARPALLNAHYLAPLEPALRAESLLGAPAGGEHAFRALLGPLADHPDALVEVSAMLVECRLFERAARWIGEAMVLAKVPMLNYLLAYCHLQRSGHEMDAGSLVAAVSREPIGPPFPWRDIERTAIAALAERFPADARLAALADTLGRIAPVDPRSRLGSPTAGRGS